MCVYIIQDASSLLVLCCHVNDGEEEEYGDDGDEDALKRESRVCVCVCIYCFVHAYLWMKRLAISPAIQKVALFNLHNVKKTPLCILCVYVFIYEQMYTYMRRLIKRRLIAARIDASQTVRTFTCSFL